MFWIQCFIHNFRIFYSFVQFQIRSHSLINLYFSSSIIQSLFFSILSFQKSARWKIISYTLNHSILQLFNHWLVNFYLVSRQLSHWSHHIRQAAIPLETTLSPNYRQRTQLAALSSFYWRISWIHCIQPSCNVADWQCTWTWFLLGSNLERCRSIFLSHLVFPAPNGQNSLPWRPRWWVPLDASLIRNLSFPARLSLYLSAM